MSCRLVVSVVHQSSMGLAERRADLQNLHPWIFLKFQSLCKLSNPRYIAYIIQYVFTVRLLVRVCDNSELSVVESVGMSYVYPASMPLRWSVAGLTRESVTTAGRDNEAASKEVIYRLTAQCLV